jgi:hypothetical protein
MLEKLIFVFKKTKKEGCNNKLRYFTSYSFHLKADDFIFCCYFVAHVGDQPSGLQNTIRDAT